MNPISENLIVDFWTSFVEHQLTYKKIIEGETDLIDDILNKLKEIRRGLAVEFEKTEDLNIMTISADGVEENFEIVENIVNKAPDILNWKIVAFRQPVNRDFIINVAGYELDPKKLKFLPIVENSELYIQIFSEELTDENEKNIGYGCLMLLDNLIGEYDCVKKVKGYEFYNTNDASDFVNDLLPLTQIRQYLDTYYREK